MIGGRCTRIIQNASYSTMFYFVRVGHDATVTWTVSSPCVDDCIEETDSIPEHKSIHEERHEPGARYFKNRSRQVFIIYTN